MRHATQLHNRRDLDDSLTMINRAGLPHDVKAAVCQQVQHAVMTTVKGTIEEALEAEVTVSLGCARYAPLPQGRLPEQTRRGGYTRAVLTQYAAMVARRVPKRRRGNGQRHWQTIARYDRGWGPRRDQHMLGDCLGLSLRDRQETMQRTVGEVLALAACHRVGLSLAPRVQPFQAACLTEPPPSCWSMGWGSRARSPQETSRSRRQGAAGPPSARRSGWSGPRSAGGRTGLGRSCPGRALRTRTPRPGTGAAGRSTPRG